MPKNGVPPFTIANAVGLPGLTAMPWKIISPRARDDIQDEIAIADRAAARENDDVRVGAVVERVYQRVEGVLRRPVPLGRAAVRGDDGPQGEAVDVVDLCAGGSGSPGSTTSLPVDRIATRGFA